MNLKLCRFLGRWSLERFHTKIGFIIHKTNPLNH